MYYHASTVVRRSRNKVDALKDSDENWISNPDDLKKLVNDFFQSLFVGDSLCNANITYKHCFSNIDPDMLYSIHTHF